MSKLQKTFAKNVLMQLGGRPKLWLANEIGMNSGSLSTAIAEDGNATLKTIEKISEALSIEAPILLGGSSSRSYEIPSDILQMLDGQSPAVFESIRTILKTISMEKSSHEKSHKNSKKN